MDGSALEQPACFVQWQCNGGKKTPLSHLLFDYISLWKAKCKLHSHGAWSRSLFGSIRATIDVSKFEQLDYYFLNYYVLLIISSSTISKNGKFHQP